MGRSDEVCELMVEAWDYERPWYDGWTYVPHSPQYDKAESIYARVLAQRPGHPEASYRRAVCLRKLGKLDEAHGQLKQARQLRPNDERLANELGMLHIALGCYEEAIECFNILTSGFFQKASEYYSRWQGSEGPGIEPEIPYDTQEEINQAILLLTEAGEYDSIEELAQKGLEILPEQHPLRPFFLEQRRLLYVRRKEYGEAIDTFAAVGSEEGIPDFIRRLPFDLYHEADPMIKETIARFPKNSDLLIGCADLYLDRFQFDDAVATYREVIDIEPNSVKALAGKIKALQAQGRSDEAEQCLQNSWDWLPEIDRLTLRARIDRDRERYDEAFKGYVAARNEEGVLSIIAALGDKKLFDKAHRLIDSAMEQGFDLQLLIPLRAQLYCDQNYYNTAIDAYLDIGDEWGIQQVVAGRRDAKEWYSAERLIKAALREKPKSPVLHRELGRVYAGEGRYEEAIESFNEAEDILPANEVIAEIDDLVFYQLNRRQQFKEAERLMKLVREPLLGSVPFMMRSGWLLIGHEKFDQAIEQFDRVRRTNRSERYNVDALLNTIAARRQQRRFDEAISLIEQALDHRPNHWIYLNERVWVHMDRNDLGLAESTWKQAAAIGSPGGPPEPESLPDLLQLSLAELRMRKQQKKEAVEILERLKTSSSNTLDIRDQYGWFCIRRNDLIAAKEEFESILKEESDNYSAHTGLGAVYFYRGSCERAEDYFRQALAMAPEAPILMTNVAQVLVRQVEAPLVSEAEDISRNHLERVWRYVRKTDDDVARGRLDEAEEHCLKALQANPIGATALGCLGVIAFKRGRLLEAADFFQKSIRLNPWDGSYVDLGSLYVQMGRYEEAEPLLNEALKVNPDDTQAHLELGNLYLQTDRHKEAIARFLRAQASDLLNEQPPRALAMALMDAGKAGEAEKVLRDALRRLDKDRRWQLHLTLAQLLARQGDEIGDDLYYEEALKEAGQALHLKPHHPDPYFHIGIIQGKLKNYPRSLAGFRDSLKRDARNYGAARLLKQAKSLMREENKRMRVKQWLTIPFALGCIAGLIAVWYFFLFHDPRNRITPTLIGALTPTLLGLAATVLLLPWLTRFKLPGLEAELQQQIEPISTGPKGEFGFGTLPSTTFSSGPH